MISEGPGDQRLVLGENTDLHSAGVALSLVTLGCMDGGRRRCPLEVESGEAKIISGEGWQF